MCGWRGRRIISRGWGNFCGRSESESLCEHDARERFSKECLESLRLKNATLEGNSRKN